MIAHIYLSYKCVFCVLFPYLKDATLKKVYISSMKKAAFILIVLAILAGTLFANGTPEDQKFFEELLKTTRARVTLQGQPPALLHPRDPR